MKEKVTARVSGEDLRCYAVMSGGSRVKEPRGAEEGLEVSPVRSWSYNVDSACCTDRGTTVIDTVIGTAVSSATWGRTGS